MRTTANQKGAVLIIFALLLLVLIGFTALAMEAGRWYMIRAELSKSVDAAALAGAKNISNPYVDPLALAQEFRARELPEGIRGHPCHGDRGCCNIQRSPAFRPPHTGHRLGDRPRLPGPALRSQPGCHELPPGWPRRTRSRSCWCLTGQDRCSMGNAIADLKTAAKSFVGFFHDTQDKDKMGLISFATGREGRFSSGKQLRHRHDKQDKRR